VIAPSPENVFEAKFFLFVPKNMNDFINNKIKKKDNVFKQFYTKG